jgi:chromosome segregation ATPase
VEKITLASEDTEVDRSRSAKELTIMQDARDQLRGEKVFLEKEREELTLTLKEAKAETEKILTEKNFWSIDFTALTESRDSLQKEKDALTDQRLSLLDELDNALDQLENAKEEAQSFAFENEKLSAKLITISESRDGLIGAKDVRETKIAELAAEVANFASIYERMGQKNASQLTENETLQTKITNLSQKLASHEQFVGRAEGDLSALRGELEEKIRIQVGEIDQLGTELDEAYGIIESLKQSLEDTSNVSLELDIRCAELENAKLAIKQLEVGNAIITEELAECVALKEQGLAREVAAAQALEKHFSLSNTDISVLQQKYTVDTTALSTKYTVDTTALSTKLLETEVALSKLKAEFAVLTSEFEVMSNRKAALDAIETDLTSKLSAMTIAKDEALAEGEVLWHKLEAATEQLTRRDKSNSQRLKAAEEKEQERLQMLSKFNIPVASAATTATTATGTGTTTGATTTGATTTGATTTGATTTTTPATEDRALAPMTPERRKAAPSPLADMPPDAPGSPEAATTATGTTGTTATTATTSPARAPGTAPGTPTRAPDPDPDTTTTTPPMAPGDKALLEAQVTSLTENLSKKAVIIRDLKASNAKLGRDIDSQTEEISRLKTDLQCQEEEWAVRLPNFAAVVEASEAKDVSLADNIAKISALEERLASLSAAAAAAQEEYAALSSEVAALQARNEALEGSLRESEERARASVATAREEAEFALKSLEESFEEREREARHSGQSLGTANDALLQDIDNYKVLNNNLENEKRSLNVIVKDLEDKVLALNADKEELNALTEDISSAAAEEIEGREQAIEALREELAGCQASLARSAAALKVCVCVGVGVCVGGSMFVCVCVGGGVCGCVCGGGYVCVCVCVVCVWVCVCVWGCVYMCICICMCMYVLKSIMS